MKAIRLVLIACLAVFATQCQSAEIPYSADKVDLRLFLENGAAISKYMFKAVNTGLDQSKPHMDKILNELAPEAKTVLSKLIADARAKIKEEETRINYVFTTLTKALDTLKPIKACSDKVSPDAKKLAWRTEKALVKIYNDIQTKFKKEIAQVKNAFKAIRDKGRNLFNTEVDAVVKCLQPGRKDSTDCMNKEVDKIIKGVTDIAFELIANIGNLNENLIEPILGEAIKELLPLLQKTAADGKVILKTLTECVSKLK